MAEVKLQGFSPPAPERWPLQEMLQRQKDVWYELPIIDAEYKPRERVANAKIDCIAFVIQQNQARHHFPAGIGLNSG